MGKLERFLNLYPHWIGYIAAGLGLFTAVFNYQHGHIEELPTDLGITLVGGLWGIVVGKILKHQQKQETAKERKERLKDTMYTIILMMAGSIIIFIYCLIEIICNCFQNKTIDIIDVDLIVASAIVTVILLIRCVCLKRKLKK